MLVQNEKRLHGERHSLRIVDGTVEIRAGQTRTLSAVRMRAKPGCDFGA
jgi:hypothetical protein